MELCKKCEKAATNYCLSCKKVYYCSKECQVADWKAHKAQCRPFEVRNFFEKISRVNKEKFSFLKKWINLDQKRGESREVSASK